MKFAIASDDGTRVAQHFGRTRGFVIVSIEAGEEHRTYVENRFTHHRQSNITGIPSGDAHRHGVQEHGVSGRDDHAHTGRSHGGRQHGDHAHNTHTHGAHGHSHQGILVALEGCSLVVSGGMGMRLRNDLNAAGIAPYVTDLQQVDDVIRAVKDETLTHLDEQSCGH